MIQTDKGHYKANDPVKFRLLVLDKNLKPPDDLRTIEEIWVEDPRHRRVAQWKEASVKLGLVQPKFQLLLAPPPAVVRDAEVTTFKVST